MTLWQQAVTIALCALGTMATRFLPFMIFQEKRPVPRYVQYLGNALPLAIFAMLIVYCLKDTSIALPPHGIPELISIIATVAVHLWRRNMLLSIFAGTACYMLIVQLALPRLLAIGS